MARRKKEAPVAETPVAETPAVEEKAVETPAAETSAADAKSNYKSENIYKLYYEDKAMKDVKNTVVPLVKGEDGYHKAQEGQKADCYQITVPFKDEATPTEEKPRMNTNRVTVIAKNVYDQGDVEKGTDGKVYNASVGSNKDGNVKVCWKERNAEGDYEPKERMISIEEFKAGVEAKQTELGRNKQAGKSDAVKEAMAKGEAAAEKATEAEASKDAQAEA